MESNKEKIIVSWTDNGRIVEKEISVDVSTNYFNEKVVKYRGGYRSLDYRKGFYILYVGDVVNFSLEAFDLIGEKEKYINYSIFGALEI
ncbi:MAG: hypothetical protein AABY32_02535 [Nanoarchaeota archaeon]